MKKRLITLMLMLCLSISVVSFAGCGEKEEEKTKSERSHKNSDEDADDEDEDDDDNDGSNDDIFPDDTEMTAEEAFEAFINKELTAEYVYEPEYGYGIYSIGEEFSLNELVNHVRGVVWSEWDNTATLSGISYAYIDCGNDGETDLAVSVCYDVANWGEASYDFIIEYIDGQLKCVYYQSGGYRTWCSVNEYGVAFEGGSGGAALYSYSYTAILPDGEVKPLYSMDEHYAMAEPIIPSYYIPISVPDDYPYEEYDENGYTMHWGYFPDGDSYTTYIAFTDIYENSVFPEEKYMDIYDSSDDINVIDITELNEMIEERVEDAGLSLDMLGGDADWVVLDTDDYENVWGDNWVDAYTAFLSDNYNFIEILSEEHGLFLACEPQMITGFTLADITGDDIPELILLGQEEWGTIGEALYVYSYNEDNGKVEGCLQTSNLSSVDGAYSNCGIPEDSVVMMDANSRCLVAGITMDNQLVTFDTWGDVTYNFSVMLYDKETLERTCIYSAYYWDEDWYPGEENEVSGDAELASQLVWEYIPLMFFKINSENIATYVCEDYLSTDIDDYTAPDVIDALRDYADEYEQILSDGIGYDGYTLTGYFHYDIEKRCQAYNNW